MKLGQRLLELGLLSQAALDEALGAQMAYGGRLGTNLVELYQLDFDDLARALGDIHGVRAAVSDDFARVDRALQAALPAEVAARWHAVPLYRGAPDDDLAIVVAVTDPLPVEARAELAEHLSAAVCEAIAPELRLLYHLERAYGVERTNRFRRVPRADTPRDERRSYVRTLADDETPPEPPSRLARIAVKQIRMPPTGLHERPIEVPTIDATVRAMRRATGRERLADLVVTAMSEGFDHALTAGMVLSVRREVLFGWCGFVRHADRHLIEAIAFPLEEPSLLRGPVTRRALYAGPPPDGGTALDHRLWLLLRTGPPAEVAVAPVELRGKIIGVLYAQAEAPIAAEHVAGLAELAQGLAAGFDRLLKANTR